MQKYRAGDVVTIFATVVSDFDPNKVEPDTHFANKIHVKPDGHYDRIFVDVDRVELITPIFRKEERVQKKAAPHVKGTVAAILDGYVWLKFDDGKVGTVEATEIQVAA